MLYTPLPAQRVMPYCAALRAELDAKHAIDADGLLSTDYLFGNARGMMFGVLLAKDQDERKHVIKAFSGQYDGHWDVPGWAPPCLDTNAFQKIVATYDGPLHTLSEGPERSALSAACQQKIFSLYRFSCIDGKERGLSDAFASMPPTGTGECAAVKLLSYAFSMGWKPVSMAEFFYGADNASGTRKNGEYYPPCEERCHPLIAMMCGLDVIYTDEIIAVVDKPEGLLSVPGNGEEKQDCVVNRLKRLFPKTIAQPSVHRLDMDTSGLLVYGLTKDAQAKLSVQFALGEVHKEYVAVIDGLLKEDGGDIDLPIRPDWEHRPYQMYAPLDGKPAFTHWEKLKVFTLKDGRVVTRVRFFPHSGRTHQLRVHSAVKEGLGHPIVGDRLYGTRLEGERLMLHADTLRFVHPQTGELMAFTSPVPF